METVAGKIVWVHITAPPRASCVTLLKSLNLCMPQFPQVQPTVGWHEGLVTKYKVCKN